MNAQSKEVLEKIQKFGGSVFYLTLLWDARDVVSGDGLQMDVLDAILVALERDGLAKLRLEFEPTTGRNRRYFDITDLGCEALTAAQQITAPDPLPHQCPDEQNESSAGDG